MWNNLDYKTKYDLMKTYKKGGFSYSDMVKDYNGSYEKFEEGGTHVEGEDVSFFDKAKAVMNPYNWGVNDYTDSGEFPEAYSQAKSAGEGEFMWNSKRFSTGYAGTPRQEVGRYGVNGIPVKSNEGLDDSRSFTPSQVNLYPPFGKFTPGHISANYGGNNIDFRPKGNMPKKIEQWSPAKREEGEESYYVYPHVSLTDRETKDLGYPDSAPYTQELYGHGKISDSFIDARREIPDIAAKNKPPKNASKEEWNLFTNNCADAVSSAFGLPDTNGLLTPSGALKNIKGTYPTLNVTGRTQADYDDMATKLWFEEDSAKVLSQSKNILGIAVSPELKESGIGKDMIVAIQKALTSEGYKLPKSTTKDGKLDGVMGPETKKALASWKAQKTKK